MDTLDFEKCLRGEFVEQTDSPLEAPVLETRDDLTEKGDYDPFSLIEKTINSDFDSSVFQTVDDSDLPLAQNWLDFCINSRYLRDCAPFPKQIKFGLEFFADYCPDCSDPAIMNDLFDQPLQEILDRVQVLHHGLCPKCHKNRLELVREGKLHLYNELAGCAGQRSGKSVWVAMTANYQLHRFLKIQNPSHYFKLMPNQTMHMVFVALTFKQASDTLWQPFLDLYDSSPWIKDYHELLDYHGEKLGRPLYEKQKTCLWYDTKRLTVYASGPDKSKLRGRTQFFSSVDELGWFLGDDKAVKLNPDEICTALENALQTIRSKVEIKRRILNEYNAPDALFINISSPSAANDKIMRLVREKSPTRYSFHLPTWEMNPNITRDSLEPLFTVSPMKAERDFGANPPLSDKPFISNPDVVESAIVAKFKNAAHYQTKLETDTLGHTTVKIHKFKMDDPCTTNVNHIIGVDTGRSKNAFAVVVQHYDLEIKSCVIDGIIEIRPQENIAVHFPSMYENVIKPIIQTRPVALVVFDKWQSISFEDELHDLKVEAVRYSLKGEDFNTIRGMILSNKIVVPKTELSFNQIKDPTQDYETLVENKPITHFAYQLLTVRDLGNTVTKGLGTDDDIFRAWCLGVRYLVDAKWQKIFQKGAKRKGKRSIGVMFGRTGGGISSGSVISGNNGPLGIVGGRSKR